ncbi:hypothetical protein BraRD5C2_28800 [Bradyrhizobium sp. RD5-C2]|nr:hypothetical protein BraRD5C2_28800 [Bradyrhizobium sp. RD5-C2]
MTTSFFPISVIASAALMVSISALASSIITLMPRWMFWGMGLSLCLYLLPPSFRTDAKRLIRNLEIPGSMLRIAPE